MVPLLLSEFWVFVGASVAKNSWINDSFSVPRTRICIRPTTMSWLMRCLRGSDQAMRKLLTATKDYDLDASERQFLSTIADQSDQAAAKLEKRVSELCKVKPPHCVRQIPPPLLLSCVNFPLN